jgi:hypothetical protein
MAGFETFWLTLLALSNVF